MILASSEHVQTWSVSLDNGLGHDVCQIVVSRCFVDTKTSGFHPFVHLESIFNSTCLFRPGLFVGKPQMRSVSLSDEAVLFCTAILANIDAAEQGEASAMISRLGPPLATITARSKSLNSTGNPGASLPTHACGRALNGEPQNPPLSRTQLETATTTLTYGEGEGGEDDATKSPCTSVGQCESRNLTDSPRRPFQRWVHSRTEIGPVRVHGRASHQPCAELALDPRCGLTLPTTLGSLLWVGGRHSQNRPTPVVRNLNPSQLSCCPGFCMHRRTRVDPV